MLIRVVLVCALSGLSTASAFAAPNIVFIMADDLGWADTSNTLTTMGDPSDFYETPTLDRLAGEGMAFTSAYANQNCAPTRTAILSGAYAPRSTNNVYQVGSLNRGGSGTMLVGPAQGLPGGDDALPTSTITHAETLQTAGYTTGYIGKFHVTDSEASITASHGFDQNFGGGTAGGPGAYHASGGVFGGSITSGLDPYAANYTQQYVDDNIKPFNNGASIADIDALVGTPKHVSDASADAAIDFMDANKSGSFFLQYSSHAVHGPIGNSQARDDLLAKYQAKTPGAEDSNASFGALIEGLDQSVARLIDYLETTADPNNPGQMLSENTLVIFYSDNGGRQNQSNNGILKGQKGELDEGGLRVPMIAWSDDASLVDGGTVNDTPVMPVDFYSTFASYAGATLPGGQVNDGVDISGIIADNTASLGRDNLYWHLPGYLVDGGRNQRPQTVTRSGDWKLLYNYEDQSVELYDLAGDLGETTNVAAANASVVDDLGTDMLNWLDDVDAPLATLRSGSLFLQIDGMAYVDGNIEDLSGGGLMIINAGEEVPYVVGSVSEFVFGDLDFNNDVNVLDWLVFKAGFDADMTGLTTEQAYALGDLDLDGDNDVMDFIAFKMQFDALNGAGAFEEAVASLPEPSSALLLLGGAACLLVRRRNRRTINARRAAPLLGVALVIGVWPMAAQATLFDFGDGSIDANTGVAANVVVAENALLSSTGTINTTVDSIMLSITGIQATAGDASTSQWGANSQGIGIRSLDSGGGTGVDQGSSGAARRRVSGSVGEAIQFSFDTDVSIDTIRLGAFTTGEVTEISFVSGVDPFAGGSWTVTGTGGSDPLFDWPVNINVTAGTVLSFTASNSLSGGVLWNDINVTPTVITPDPVLTLEVNRFTGKTYLLNDEAGAVDFDFYEVTSAGDALQPGGWLSLEDSDFEGNGAPGTGDGWEELGTPAPAMIAEAYLLGSSSLASGARVDLGFAYDPADPEDLALRFHETGGAVLNGDVVYVETGNFDMDSDIDGLDIDALFAEDGNTAPPTDAKFDLIGDGTINADPNTADSDIDELVKVILGTEYGDANLDRKVSLLDLNTLGANFGNAGGWAQGDYNGDGTVSLLDLNTLGANFGFDNAVPAAPSAPEPASLALLAMGGLALARRRNERDLV